MFVLDTHVVSELRKLSAGKADPRVASWADAVDAGSLHISAITVLELEIGILQIERRDPVQSLNVPDPRAERDALIAATALVHGMIVVTRNVADFAATGVPCLDPWQRAT
jgi:predicted nucleic acid-binding protein